MSWLVTASLTTRVTEPNAALDSESVIFPFIVPVDCVFTAICADEILAKRKHHKSADAVKKNLWSRVLTGSVE
jgi:hypothetical protein